MGTYPRFASRIGQHGLGRLQRRFCFALRQLRISGRHAKIVVFYFCQHLPAPHTLLGRLPTFSWFARPGRIARLSLYRNRLQLKVCAAQQ